MCTVQMHFKITPLAIMRTEHSGTISGLWELAINVPGANNEETVLNQEII